MKLLLSVLYASSLVGKEVAALGPSNSLQISSSSASTRSVDQTDNHKRRLLSQAVLTTNASLQFEAHGGGESETAAHPPPAPRSDDNPSPSSTEAEHSHGRPHRPERHDGPRPAEGSDSESEDSDMEAPEIMEAPEMEAEGHGDHGHGHYDNHGHKNEPERAKMDDSDMEAPEMEAPKMPHKGRGHRDHGPGSHPPAPFPPSADDHRNNPAPESDHSNGHHDDGSAPAPENAPRPAPSQEGDNGNDNGDNHKGGSNSSGHGGPFRRRVTAPLQVSGIPETIMRSNASQTALILAFEAKYAAALNLTLGDVSASNCTFDGVPCASLIHAPRRLARRLLQSTGQLGLTMQTTLSGSSSSHVDAMTQSVTATLSDATRISSALSSPLTIDGTVISPSVQSSSVATTDFSSSSDLEAGIGAGPAPPPPAKSSAFALALSSSLALGSLSALASLLF